jgi:prefoldin subunit 5
MEAELYNLYVEKLLNEVVELTKTKLILSAQLEFQQKNNNKLNERISELETALDKVKSKTKKTEGDF